MLLGALPPTNKSVGEQIKETIPKNGSSFFAFVLHTYIISVKFLYSCIYTTGLEQI